MIRGESATAAEDEFIEMTDAVNAMKVETAKDVPAWSEAASALGAVTLAGNGPSWYCSACQPYSGSSSTSQTLSLIGGMTLLGFRTGSSA